MLKGLEYVKETIEFRENDIAGNEFETNNLLMDDILVALGYNKRREQGVKAVYSGESDWEISCNDENRFTIAVYGYGSDRPTPEQLGVAFDFADKGEYKFVVVTDGKKLDIYHEGSLAVQIDDIFDVYSDEILNALSRNGWEPEVIISKLAKVAITQEQIVGVLKEEMNDLIIDILSKLNINDTEENISAVESILISMLDGEEASNAKVEQLLKDKAVLLDEVSKLMAEVLSLKASGEEVEKLNIQVIEQSGEINKLKEQLSLAEKSDNNHSNTQSNNESTYREKITQLTEENQSLKLDIDTYKATLADIEKKQANKEDEKVTMARQLLDAVEDNKDLNRAYVGVVNARLFQIGELNKFVGTCIQELYSTVSFELMHLLFDGDIFKIVQPAVRCDLLINAKSYDIDISMLNEDEVISRLKSLFGKFEKVVFMCKTVGTLHVMPEAEQIIAENIDEDITEYTEEAQSDNQLEGQLEFDGEDASEPNFTGEEQSEYSAIDDFIDGDSDLPIFEEPEIGDQNTEAIFEDGEFEEPELINQDEAEVYVEVFKGPTVLRLPLCEIGMVLWSEENPIVKPVAIGNNEKTFKLDSDSTFNSAVISLLNMSDDILKSIETLTNTDLTEISANIHLGNETETDERILQTNYYTDTSDSKKYISVLLTLAEVLYIDSYETYMYFETGDSISENLEACCIAESALEELTSITPEITECINTIHCILSGSALEKVINMRGIKEAAEELISNTVAVRTTYMTTALKVTVDIAKAFETCMERIPSDELVEAVHKVNTFNNSKIILSEEDEFSGDSIEFVVGDKTYIIDTPTSSSVVFAMFILHSYGTGDTAIDIRVELNSTLYTHFNMGASTSDCYKYFARNLLCKVMEGKTKIINK